jgi:hypothetical protein
MKINGLRKEKKVSSRPCKRLVDAVSLHRGRDGRARHPAKEVNMYYAVSYNDEYGTHETVVNAKDKTDACLSILKMMRATNILKVETAQ